MDKFWGFVRTYEADIKAFFESIIDLFKAAFAKLNAEDAA